VASFDGSPFELDRELSRAFEAWRAWRLRLKLEPRPEDQPLERYHESTTRRLFTSLGELVESDPLREPLRRWVYRLTEQRVNHAAITELARARYSARYPVRTPFSGERSASDMFARALSEPGRREPWLEAFMAQAPALSSPAVTLWQRRGEVARRMGVASPRVIEGATDDAVKIAERAMFGVRERLAELRLGTALGWLEAALGEDVSADWPGRLSGPRLLDYFRDGDLFRGLDLRARSLPQAVGAASFLRGLARLGGAWFEAQAPRDQPFVIAREPYRLEEHTAAYLFGLLPQNPAFLQRKLDVGRDALTDVSRRLAQLAALELAQLALKVRLRHAAHESEAALREGFQEWSELELGLRLPRAAAGVWFRLRSEDEQRLLGFLVAHARAERLTEAHDEDWFRNPRALEQLRAEARLPPRHRMEQGEADAALDVALRRMQSLWR
jgi:hypothetical protein